MFGLSNKRIIIISACIAGTAILLAAIMYLGTSDERAIGETLDNLRDGILIKNPIAITDAFSPAYNYEGVTFEAIKLKAVDSNALGGILFDDDKLDFSDINIEIDGDKADVKFRWNAKLRLPYSDITDGDLVNSFSVSGVARFGMRREGEKWLIREVDLTITDPPHMKHKIDLSRLINIG